MPIVIRHRQRFRATACYEGKNYCVARYEREHDPASWMFVIDDNVNDLAMECDEGDAVALEHDLRQVASAILSEAAFEAKLKSLFDVTMLDLPPPNNP